MDVDNNIKVAIRIRPQVPKEVIDMCSVCTDVTPNEPQVWLGKDKAFTFDHVFDLPSRQEEVYTSCCHQLIEGCFEGYNATILAYGQTGSGKTYTMGTGLDIGGTHYEKGIIPRAVEHLFDGIKRRQEEAKSRGLPPPEFNINAQFLELYNEEVIDLLSEEKTKHSQIKIREDADGGMYLTGATTRPVNSVEECVYWLKQGALSRTTGATQMNAQSSRSHAIFTLHVKQLRVVPIEDEMSTDDVDDKENKQLVSNQQPTKTECETLTAKFHFVDLAGSERLKRTGATGDRQKEGISINSGLLALGNVISALGDKSKRANHIPYRDSKLTRLLQDSLGGNSRTLMIACVSPSDRDFMETLNTLRYANRAKNIKNRIVANQDKSSQTINVLRRQIQQLQFELMEYKQGKKLIGDDGTERVNDMYHENNLLQTEIANLKTRVKALQDTNARLTEKNILLLAEKETGSWITGEVGEASSNIGDIIHKYLTEIEDLRTKLIEAEETCSQLRKQALRTRMTMSPHINNAISMSGHYDIQGGPEAETDVVLEEAKREVALQKKLFSVKKELFSHKSSSDPNKDSQDANGNETLQNGKSSQGLVNGDDHLKAAKEGDGGTSNEVSDEEEEYEDDDDEEEDNEDAVSQMDIELLELTNEITTKEKLIAELEKNQRKLRKIKQDYEDKLAQLQVQIKSIESERDQVLAKLSQAGHKKDGEQAKKIRADFQSKISGLQNELKVMEVMKKEHIKKMREQTRYEQESKKLKSELADMKKAKVRLVNQMKEEAAKHRQAEMKNSKKIAQLSKLERMKDGKIRTLESEKNRMQSLLKRKEEENNALKKQTIKSSMSDRVAGRVPRKNQINKSMHGSTTFRMTASQQLSSPVKSFSPKKAKSDWNKLEQTINKLVLSRQTILKNEEQMDRELKTREKLTKQKLKLEKDLEKARRERKSLDVVRSIQEEIESVEENIRYVSGNIVDCQQVIVQLEENKEEVEDQNMIGLVMTAPRDEVKYLFEKLVAHTTNQAMIAAQREEERKDLEMRLHQKADDSMITEQLLHHVLEQSAILSPGMDPANQHDTTFLAESGFVGLPPGMSYSNEVLDSFDQDMRCNSPSTIMSAPTPELPSTKLRLNVRPSDRLDPSAQSSPQTRREKARRLTKTTQELLFESSVSGAIPFIEPIDEVMTQSLPPGSSLKDIERAPSVPSLKSDTNPRLRFEPSPSLTRRIQDRSIAESRRLNKTSTNLSAAASTSPVHVPGIPMSASNNTISTSLLASSSSNSSNCSQNNHSLLQNQFLLNPDLLPDTTPPASPSMLRRNRDENVFSRLTSGTTSAGIGNPDRGVIAPFTAKAHYDKHSPLICTHVAEGHSRSVLSVCATNDVMFTGSKDNTVKIWDLHTGQEMQSLVDHPDSVTVVRYNEFSRLAFSVSKSYIKVWDPRDNPARCVKTLNSSGLLSGITVSQTKGNEMPHGETKIFDIQLSMYGTTLFSTCGHIVRSWDLRMFMCIGKLNTGHQANIMCLAVEEGGIETNTVVTGSKDHYIKVFEVMEGIGGIQNPRATLTPPHYDGIEALKIHNDYLFSASRDACIKKWDLNEHKVLHSVNCAHKDWIQSLAILPNSNTLISGCRQGYLKLWATDSPKQCNLISDVRAHSGAINCIDTNSSLVFTASGDTTVALWRNRSSGEPSPDISE